MKRFVTYLYEYERGGKTKNTGFIRVDIRNSQVSMEVCIRNCMSNQEMGKMYVLVKDKVLLGIQVGEVKVLGRQSNSRFLIETNNMMDSGYSIDDVVGIGIRLRNNAYMASCWNDEDVEEVGNGNFEIYQKEIVIEEAEMVEEITAEETREEKIEAEEIVQDIEREILDEPLEELSQDDSYTTYQKIELNQIRNLPSQNWHLCNNSFLVHGFFNYGYLVLKKEVEENQEKCWLGVPGFIEKPEVVMAMLFGFPDFAELPAEIVDAEMGIERRFPNIKTNQEPPIGTFGCWFVALQI